MFKKKKEKNKIILPVYETNPIPEGENGSGRMFGIYKNSRKRKRKNT